MTLMIELVGGQYLPNVLPVRHYHPENVLLVYTSGPQGTTQQYQRLAQLLGKERSVEGLLTDAYDVPKIVKKLGDKLQDYQRPELFFNLTGGTKAMVLAAHQLAMQYSAPICYVQSEGTRSVVYHYNWHNNQLGQPSQEELPEYLSLDEILDLHYGQGTWGDGVPSNNTGGLFEQAIADVLRSHQYEVKCAVKDDKKQLDTDIMIRYQNHVGIIEAKAGDQARSIKGIYQLSTVVRRLGTYTKQFLVIHQDPSEPQQIIRDELGINLIQLLEYQKDQRSLTTADTNLLLAEIDRQMKGSVPRP